MKFPAVLLALAILAPIASAQPKVTQRITAPYAPVGYALELTEDCGIESAGGAPDARLRCAPGLGWRITDETGAVIYPRNGYLPRDIDWAFGGVGSVAFLDNGRVTAVKLPAGESQQLGRGDVEQLIGVEGLPLGAVVWLNGAQATGPVGARPLRDDGSLGDVLKGSDMRRVDNTRGRSCRRAAVLAAIGAEMLPNSTWLRIERRSAAHVGTELCQSVYDDRLAGLGADGKWRPLDVATFKPIGSATFHSAAESFEWQ